MKLYLVTQEPGRSPELHMTYESARRAADLLARQISHELLGIPMRPRLPVTITIVEVGLVETEVVS